MRKKLGEMLIEAGVLTEAGLKAALVEQRKWGGSLGRTLVDMRQIREDELVGVLSRQLGLQSVDLDAMKIPPSVVALVPGDIAQKNSIMPFGLQMKFLDVAMADPTNLGIVDELRIRTQLNVRQHLAGPKMIERAIARYYGRGFNSTHLGTISRPEIPIVPDEEIELAEFAPPSHRPAPRMTYSPVTKAPRDAEIDALQIRISELEALVQRDEEVLRKLLGLLVEKGIATREEILERLG